MSATRLPFDDEDWPRLADEVKRADHCHGLVVRDGDQDACGKPPVAIIDGRGIEEGSFWPACAYHAHRYGRGSCVPLATVVTALRGSTRRPTTDFRLGDLDPHPVGT